MRVPIHPPTTVAHQPDGRNFYPGSGPECNPAIDSRALRAVGHALILVGCYRGTPRRALVRRIHDLPPDAITWVLSADAEQLRSDFLPPDPACFSYANACK